MPKPIRTPVARLLLLTGVLLTALAGAPAGAQTTPPMKESDFQVARRAFEAWQEGEKTGRYEAFKALLSDAFVRFSHPLVGDLAGKEALAGLRTMIRQREGRPDALTFSNVVTTRNENTVVFQFDSGGTIGGAPFRGYNVIAFTVAGGRLTGFREYFGFVDPKWFK